MKIAMIACVGKNLELGLNNNLIWHLPLDLKYFKEVTNNHVVLMGKNTFKSLPGVLKNRHNIVLTRSINRDDIPREVEVFHSIDEFLKKYQDYDDVIFIIGGESIYKQFIDLADTLYLTEVDAESLADTYFPKFKKEEFRREVLESHEDSGIKYQFVKYRRK